MIIGEAAIMSETQQHTGIIFFCALQKVFFKLWILMLQVKVYFGTTNQVHATLLVPCILFFILNERDTFELMQAR